MPPLPGLLPAKQVMRLASNLILVAAAEVVLGPLIRSAMQHSPQPDSQAAYSERIRRLVDQEKERTSSPAAAATYAKNQALRFFKTYELCCQLVPETKAVV